MAASKKEGPAMMRRAFDYRKNGWLARRRGRP
jgi:hypothetical protein